MVLKKVKQILEKEKFECSLSPSTAEFPADSLLVFLALDPKKRERMLEIAAGQQQAGIEFMMPQAAEIPYRIQFAVKLPFKVIDLALSQVASLLHFINQFIDLPGFELNEMDGEVIYRYVWIISPSVINAAFIMSIVGSMMLNLSLFAETIESLADGRMSFNDLLSQIVKISETAKSGKSN